MVPAKIKVEIDSDDAGIDLKIIVYEHLKEQGVDITDLQYLQTKNLDFLTTDKAQLYWFVFCFALAT
ncbi:MAG: hypothetical protein ACYST5_18615 [Planctomycetota bacterium]|jgi:ribose 5-phosphate isomerase RpiB